MPFRLMYTQAMGHATQNADDDAGGSIQTMDENRIDAAPPVGADGDGWPARPSTYRPGRLARAVSSPWPSAPPPHDAEEPR